MTGLELLRGELKNRGCTASQVNSKIVAVVLDILANSGGKYTEYFNLDAEIAYARNRLRELKNGISVEEYRLERRKEEIAVDSAKLEKSFRDAREYIDNFNDSLTKCETAESRDAMRAAQVFVNSTRVETKYDNTAFIIGLSSILTRGSVDGITELKKINKNLVTKDWRTI